MRLTRNTTASGRCKYAIIKLKGLDTDNMTPEQLAQEIIKDPSRLDWGEKGSDSEFFVLRLKDVHTSVALHYYAHSVMAKGNDPQYAGEVFDLAKRSLEHPGKKEPDL